MTEFIATAQLPTEFGTATKLRDLSFYGNRFQGSIPSEVGHLTRLTSLFVQHELSLTGSIPKEVYGLKNLKGFGFQNVSLTGTLSPAIGNLENLQGAKG